MKFIWDQLIEAAITSKYNRSAFNEKTNFFGLSFLLFFWDCRSTNLLRLFSGNLPAMFNGCENCGWASYNGLCFFVTIRRIAFFRVAVFTDLSEVMISSTSYLIFLEVVILEVPILVSPKQEQKRKRYDFVVQNVVLFFHTASIVRIGVSFVKVSQFDFAHDTRLLVRFLVNSLPSRQNRALVIQC